MAKSIPKETCILVRMAGHHRANPHTADTLHTKNQAILDDFRIGTEFANHLLEPIIFNKLEF